MQAKSDRRVAFLWECLFMTHISDRSCAMRGHSCALSVFFVHHGLGFVSGHGGRIAKWYRCWIKQKMLPLPYYPHIQFQFSLYLFIFLPWITIWGYQAYTKKSPVIDYH
ncbi:hypothetical protein BDA99DRAFT_512945 [Phascolomyces articulosus]|uniref:Uncharacterized protein n=1 Tax=Phascolomyces articulosus TaxID=60185 RepID=A0AAD5PDH6_9FUNG|nr:hypothetical protein BDA99DRAFT_512945 [Phascolomyces articulosus]